MSIFEEINGWIKDITFLGHTCFVDIHKQEYRALHSVQVIILDTNDWRLTIITNENHKCKKIFTMAMSHKLYMKVKILAKMNSIVLRYADELIN